MSLWWRAPERVPSRFACEEEAPTTTCPARSVAPVAREPAGPSADGLAGRLMRKLAGIRGARVGNAAATC